MAGIIITDVHVTISNKYNTLIIVCYILLYLSMHLHNTYTAITPHECHLHKFVVLDLGLALDQLWCVDSSSGFNFCLRRRVFEILAFIVLLLSS